jgi:iron complex outermembrane receptor protein
MSGIRSGVLCLATCLLASYCRQVHANHNSYHESEQDFMGDIDTVISATRIRQPLTESPSSITIIDRDTIAASGAIEVADVMRLVPGVQVAYPQGNQIAVSYHGYGDAFPRDMQILVDGRSIYQPSFADVDWLFLGVELEDIERIEVIRGPNSAFYGSNAVAGVINIITRLPLQDQGTLARVTAGDLNTRNGILRHGDRVGELDYRLTLNYQASDGFDTDINSTNDDRELQGFAWRSTWHPRPSDEVDFQLGYTDGNTGGGAEPTHDPPAHDKEVTSHYQFVSWQRAQENQSELRAQLYHNYYDSSDHYRDQIAHAFELPDEVVQALLGTQPDESANFGVYDYEGERYDMELQYTSPASDRLRTVSGAGLRLNRLQSEALTNRDGWIDEVSGRLFTNINYRAGQHLLLNAGMFLESSDEFDTHFSPRLNASWLFDADHSVRASYARAKRNPSLVEANFNVVNRLDDSSRSSTLDGDTYFIDIINDNPDPETLTSIEIGYVGYWLERRLMFDAKLFHERTDDYIHRVQDCLVEQPIPVTECEDVPGVAVYMNNGEHTVKGGEFQLKYETAPRDFVSLQASILETDNEGDRRINDPDGPRLFFPNETVAPEYTISLLGSKSLDAGFEISSAFYYLSKMVWLGDGDRLKYYNRIDARVARRWRSGTNNLMLEGIVQNVDEPYYSFRDENVFDTRAYLRFTIDWL